MKAARLLTAIAALVLTAAPLAAQPRADHVVLVSVDGFRPDFYLPGSSWPAPNIQQMARDGAHAEGVRGVFPTVTYPSHTTIVTGALPARHGVYYNRPFEPEGQTGEWYWFESSIQVDTLWDAVRAAGKQTAAISWPVTVGAPIDRFVPETYSLDPNSDRLAPMREGTTPGLWQELEREATGRLSLRNYGSAYITRDDTTGAMAAYVLETHRPALIALHLITTDSAQHAHGRESDRARRAVAAADRADRRRPRRRGTGPASSNVPPSSSRATTASSTFTPSSCPTSGWPRRGCTAPSPIAASGGPPSTRRAARPSCTCATRPMPRL